MFSEFIKFQVLFTCKYVQTYWEKYEKVIWGYCVKLFAIERGAVLCKCGWIFLTEGIYIIIRTHS